MNDTVIQSILPALILMGGAFLILWIDLVRGQWPKRGVFVLTLGLAGAYLHFFILQTLPPWVSLAAGFFGLVIVAAVSRWTVSSDALEYVAYLALATALLDVLRKLGSIPIAEPTSPVLFDGFSLFMTIAVLAATALSLLLAANLVSRFRILMSEYLALVLFGAGGMVLLTMAAELITFFVSLEILSLAVYVLTGVTRRNVASNEAALKYFVIGTFATGFLLYGMALLYGATGTVYLKEITQRLTLSPMTVVGIGMLVVGLAFKIAAVPFHMWVPDAYEGAPTAVTAFMSVSVKTAAFAALMRLLIGALPKGTDLWGDVLFAVAILTMILGNLLALGQQSVKRMLAYSSIAHTGYALIGVVCATKSALAQEAVAATSFYLFAYTFMTLGAFAFLIFAGRPDRDAEGIQDHEGLAKIRPAAALMMTLFMLSLAGVPPTAGFFGKFYLFRVAVEAGEPRFLWLALVAVVTTLISLYYYLRVVVALWMKPYVPPQGGLMPQDPNVGAAVSIAAFFTLLIGVIPSNYLALAVRYSGSLFLR